MGKRVMWCIKYTYLYGGICKGYMHLEYNPITWGTIYSVISGLISLFLVWYISEELLYSLIAGLMAIFIPYVLVKPGLFWLIKQFNCTGIKGGCIFPGKHFHVKGNGAPCELRN